MKKLVVTIITAGLLFAGTALPVGAATPPTYGDALDCLFGGLTNGPDSDADMVDAVMLVFEAAAEEAAGEYEDAFELLEDAFEVLEDAEDSTLVDCTGAVAASAGELAGYTVELWEESGARKKQIKHANKHIARGDKHLAKGKPDRALKEYGRALDHAVDGLHD